jgi:UDP-glucose 4-epimerase
LVFKNEKVVLLRGNIANFELVKDIVLDSDYVFNLAAVNVGNSIIHPEEDLRTNALGPLNIMRAAMLKPSVRIVHASSGSVLGSSDTPMKEDSPYNPTTPYAITKLAGEKYCEFYAKEYNIKVSIIRYFHVYGPRQDYRGRCGVINIFLSEILNNRPPVVWGSGEQIKCFTFVKDSVRATLLLAENDDTIGQIYNVASNVRISIKDLACKLIEMFSADKTMVPQFGPAKVGENMRPIPNTDKVESLGWQTQYSFDRGLTEAYDWLSGELYGE